MPFLTASLKNVLLGIEPRAICVLPGVLLKPAIIPLGTDAYLKPSLPAKRVGPLYAAISSPQSDLTLGSYVHAFKI